MKLSRCGSKTVPKPRSHDMWGGGLVKSVHPFTINSFTTRDRPQPVGPTRLHDLLQKTLFFGSLGFNASRIPMVSNIWGSEFKGQGSEPRAPTEHIPACTDLGWLSKVNYS